MVGWKQGCSEAHLKSVFSACHLLRTTWRTFRFTAVAAVKLVLSDRPLLKCLFPTQSGASDWVCHNPTSFLFQMTVTAKLWHLKAGRSLAASFREHSNEHANPIPRPDPVHNHEETQDQVLQSRSEGKKWTLWARTHSRTTSKMFFSTKNCWHPREQYHRCRRELNPPRDRLMILRFSISQGKCYPVFHLPFEKMQSGIFTNMLYSKILMSFHLKNTCQGSWKNKIQSTLKSLVFRASLCLNA